MKITIHANKEAKQLTITIQGLDWEKVESGSFPAGEETIQELLAQERARSDAAVAREQRSPRGATGARRANKGIGKRRVKVTTRRSTGRSPCAVILIRGATAGRLSAHWKQPLR